jgi:putative hydrolase of the HAD superfamily
MNVVFDFGGVLFRWQPMELVRRVLPHRATDEASVRRLVAEIFQGYEGDWADFDRGTVEPEALVERIAARTGIGLEELQAVVDEVPAALEPNEDTVALLERLHAAGRPLYFISNMPAPYAAYLERQHEFLQRFRRGVFSARVRMIKPDAEIFEHARTDFGIDPAHSVFIDDHAPNIVAARAAGWRAIHFEHAAQCEAELVAQGLL